MRLGEHAVKIGPALLTTLQAAHTVLTPNHRAARTLRRGFDASMHEAGHAQWQPAKVLALEPWMASLWHQLLLHGQERRMLLNSNQEYTLWMSILEADAELSGLRSHDQLAALAARAWSLTLLHHGRERLRDMGEGTDSRAFAGWARKFEQRCKRDGYVPAAQLPEVLAGALADGVLDLPEDGLTLVDFEQQPPAIEALFDSIERAGYAIAREQTAVNSVAHLYAAASDSDELRAAAQWCRAQLAEDSGRRLAVVVTNQAECRHQLERVFAEVLAPTALPITSGPHTPLFEFSLGRSLAQHPSVATALNLLRWTMYPLPRADISALLLSPAFAFTQEDFLSFAEFDVQVLRQTALLRPELTLEAFLDLLRGGQARSDLGREGLAGLRARLQALRRAAQDNHLGTPDRQPYAEWSDAFRSVLEAAGAGTGSASAASRDSLAYQAQQRWESVLDELATLDFDNTQVNSAQALAQLTRIAGETVFAPESQDAPIQILGPLELGGVPFDGLWLLGADDLQWPPLAGVHPFLPWAVQQALGMPGADAARDRRRARMLTSRVAGSAAEVVFSYARLAEDGTRRVSPLVTELDLVPLALELDPQLDTAAIVHFSDRQPIAPLPDRVMRGGASILELQAACAFRAFAQKRLQSSPPESPDIGLDPRERGTIVHTVMELFWARVQDQTTLIAMRPGERETRLESCIDEALAATARNLSASWDQAYLHVQRVRLLNLLGPWLEHEATRPYFAVRERESTHRDVKIGPLRIDMRVDRVDETEQGPVIIDYKTGSAATSAWLSARPDQPQLPLYAVLAGERVAGIAFVVLKPGKEFGLKGYATSDTVFGKPAKMPLALPDQVEEWTRTLTSLAEAFAAGDAAVLPKCYPKTCKYCDQRILCRLDLTALEVLGEEEEPEVADL